MSVDAGASRLIPPPPPDRRARRLVRMTATGGGPVDRGNRVAFVVVGAVLAAAGVAGLLLGQGTVKWSSPGREYRRLASDAAGNPDLAAGIAMAVCLVAFLLGMRWAFAQLRPVSDGERLGTFRVGDDRRGQTTVAAASVARAAAADLASRPGVASAKARIRAFRPRARVTLSAELDLDADLEGALAEIQGALGRLLEVLGTPATDADAEIRVRFARAPRSSRSSPSSSGGRRVS